MLDLTELVLGALTVVLAAAAIAVGVRVIRDAWRAGFVNPVRDAQRHAGTWEQATSEGLPSDTVGRSPHRAGQ